MNNKMHINSIYYKNLICISLIKIELNERYRKTQLQTKIFTINSPILKLNDNRHYLIKGTLNKARND